MSGSETERPETERSETERSEKRRRVEFDDALKGYYQDHDAVLPDENADYKSLTAESVGSLILGFLSALTFLSMLFAIFPIMGIVLGITAIRKILRATEIHSGLGIASTGAALSLTLLIAGTVYHSYRAQYAVPLGYRVIQWSDLLGDPRTGRIPAPILELTKPQQDANGSMYFVPVFIEGYMHPTQHQTEIRSFVLVPEIRRGPFGTITPNPTQMIEVTLSGDRRVAYRSTPVRVGGILTVNAETASGTTPYSLRADLFR